MNDPYGTLGVRPDASDEDIAKAYKQLAKRYHPDLNPGNASAAQKMGQINQAYDQIKTMRQSGNRQNSRPSGAYGSQSAYSDPFAGVYQNFYRRYRPDETSYEDYSRYHRVSRGSSMFRLSVAIILAMLLVRIFGVLLSGTTPVQQFLYGSDASREPAYSYYYYYPMR